VTSRERVIKAVNHQEADRVPLDLGASPVTGMHVSTVYRLRQALELDPPGTPVKVVEPLQMLGEIGDDLREALGVDTVGLQVPVTNFGFRLEGWKEWRLFDATPVLVPAGFNTEPEPNGDILLYPHDDRSVPASGRMPKDGWYFDAIVRQPPLDENNLKVEDNLEEFGPASGENLAWLKAEAERLYTRTDRAILANFGGTSFGDIARVPGTALKHPRGIRDMAEWYMSLASRPEHLYRIFEKQCEIGLANLEKYYQAVGDRVTAVMISGTDFGAQHGPFISPATYRKLFQPFHRQVNDWVHRHTPWKIFIHTCGSVRDLLPDLCDAGFDILNPVQTSAARMDPAELKREFGSRLVFWGGGLDTQRVLPFGSPREVTDQVRERLRTFGAGGGFVFNTVHNVQARVPVENVLALYQAVRRHGVYPLD